jgi:hypothetical protein
MTKAVLLAVLTYCALASANPPALVTYDAKAFTISVPKGWNVVADASKGTVVAQQDPKRKDAAQLLVMAGTGSTTADQVLDALLKQVAASMKVTKREKLPNDAGLLVVADGTTDGIKVRLGAIAAGKGTVVVGLLITKVDDFEALGGTTTIATVLASIKVASTAPASTTAPPSSAATLPAGRYACQVLNYVPGTYTTTYLPSVLGSMTITATTYDSPSYKGKGAVSESGGKLHFSGGPFDHWIAAIDKSASGPFFRFRKVGTDDPGDKLLLGDHLCYLQKQ